MECITFYSSRHAVLLLLYTLIFIIVCCCCCYAIYGVYWVPLLHPDEIDGRHVITIDAIAHIHSHIRVYNIGAIETITMIIMSIYMACQRAHTTNSIRSNRCASNNAYTYRIFVYERVVANTGFSHRNVDSSEYHLLYIHNIWMKRNGLPWGRVEVPGSISLSNKIDPYIVIYRHISWYIDINVLLLAVFTSQMHKSDSVCGAREYLSTTCVRGVGVRQQCGCTYCLLAWSKQQKPTNVTTNTSIKLRPSTYVCSCYIFCLLPVNRVRLNLIPCFHWCINENWTMLVLMRLSILCACSRLIQCFWKD